jgi:tRNA nucleotidyltransferase (CCA-adding enzyme)
VTERSFAEDPLRLVRGLRFLSQLDFDADAAMVEQMRDEAPSIRLVSAERIGGGVRADGLGELSKLLLGAKPAKALRLARDTGVLVELLPPYRDAIGYDLHTQRQPLPLDEHMFAVVQNAADAGASLPVRLAALLHDLGKPHASIEEHAARGAEIAAAELLRLRYPSRLQTYVAGLVREHAFFLEDFAGDVGARWFLRRHGDELAFDLVRHKRADLAAKGLSADELDAFERRLEQGRTSPHRLADLAVDGADLIEIGFREGPELGQALQSLLDQVVEDPSLNERGALLERAAALQVVR